MSKFNSGVAYDEDVFEKALEILKEEGVETDIHQLKRVYEFSAKNTKKVFNEEPYCAINLYPIGRAYYHLYDTNKVKTVKKNMLHYENISDKAKEVIKKQVEVWQQRYDDIKMEYELYRPKENVSKKHLFPPIIQNLRRAIKRRKISSKETEEIQNNIK
jgi:hypothetical protein